MTIRVGTSGWSYDHWSGVLYPEHTSPTDRLTYYVTEFDTVELNASFYRWPAESTFQRWHRDVLVYFNNDEFGYAAHNARTLRSLLTPLAG